MGKLNEPTGYNTTDKKVKAIFKDWWATAATSLIYVTLYGFLAVSLGWRTPDLVFWTELLIVTFLNVQIHSIWSLKTTKSVKESASITSKETVYQDLVEAVITDKLHFDKFIEKINKDNINYYITNKLRNRTPNKLNKRTLWIIMLNWFLKKENRIVNIKQDELAELNIDEDDTTDYTRIVGQYRYERLYSKIEKKAHQNVRKIIPEDVITMSENKMLYDSKNHSNRVKLTFNITSTIITIMFTSFLAFLDPNNLSINLAATVKYLGYSTIMFVRLISTIVSTKTIVEEETTVYLLRLQHIVESYKSYKKTTPVEGEKENGNSNDSINVCGRVAESQ